MVAMELLVRAAALRDLRRREAEIASALAAESAAFQATHAALIESVRQARNATAAAETALKAIAQEEYKQTAETKLCPGITVKLFETFTYDEQVAYRWCKQAGIAINPESLNRKEFEKIAKASPLAFVEYVKEPRVQISEDLDKALASVDGATAEVGV